MSALTGDFSAGYGDSVTYETYFMAAYFIFHSHSEQSKDSSPKWPIMCRVGRKTVLTQLIRHYQSLIAHRRPQLYLHFLHLSSIIS